MPRIIAQKNRAFCEYSNIGTLITKIPEQRVEKKYPVSGANRKKYLVSETDRKKNPVRGIASPPGSLMVTPLINNLG